MVSSKSITALSIVHVNVVIAAAVAVAAAAASAAAAAAAIEDDFALFKFKESKRLNGVNHNKY